MTDRKTTTTSAGHCGFVHAAVWCAIGWWLESASATGLAAEPGATPAPRPASVPVIYCTDLFHPHEDPDDHFDLAVLLAHPELDVRAVILDQGGRQRSSPGRIPVSQISHLTGRTLPAGLGLEHPLQSPSDAARGQKSEFQQGVELILRTLREAAQPVRIAAVGSLRDLAAAFNREPGLCRAKVGRLLVFIGEASDPAFREYNVQLDPHAFVCLMRSDLPVYWVPCFDGGLWQNRGRASFWQARHADLLRGAAPGLVQYFIYALEKETTDPLAFLARPVDPVRRDRLFAGTRNLWCTAIFGVLADRQIVRVDDRWQSLAANDPRLRGPNRLPELFGFSEVELSVNDQAQVRYGPGPGARKMMRFEIRRSADYASAMTAITADWLARLTKP